MTFLLGVLWVFYKWNTVVHEIIDATVEAVGDGTRSSHLDTAAIPIKQARSPCVEWVDNAKSLRVYSRIYFLRGQILLPSGSLSRDYIDHFMHYWDGRFEKAVTFTAMLFNQLQRHAAVQKAVRVGITHGKTMGTFGKLISTAKYKEASRLNAGFAEIIVFSNRVCSVFAV